MGLGRTYDFWLIFFARMFHFIWFQTWLQLRVFFMWVAAVFLLITRNWHWTLWDTQTASCVYIWEVIGPKKANAIIFNFHWFFREGWLAILVEIPAGLSILPGCHDYAPHFRYRISIFSILILVYLILLPPKAFKYMQKLLYISA